MLGVPLITRQRKPVVPPHTRSTGPEDGRRCSCLSTSRSGFCRWSILSTLEALKHGGREANPVVAPFASNAGALYSLKVATTAGTIWAAEKLWKRNRAAAIVTMFAVNAGYAWVAHHNYQIAGR